MALANLRIIEQRGSAGLNLFPAWVRPVLVKMSLDWESKANLP
jgi:hypothetical protein